MRNEEGLIYLNKTPNEQINDFQVTNGPINGMYQWARRVVERTLAAQSMEGEDLMEHEMLHLNKKKIIKPETKISFEYEVELSDSEKCEYIDASISVCIEMPVVDTKEVHGHIPVLKLEAVDRDKSVSEEEIVIDNILFKEECVVDELSLLSEYCSYPAISGEHEEERESEDVYQGTSANPVDSITSSEALEELIRSCRSSRVEVENVMTRFTRQPETDGVSLLNLIIDRKVK